MADVTRSPIDDLADALRRAAEAELSTWTDVATDLRSVLDAYDAAARAAAETTIANRAASSLGVAPVDPPDLVPVRDALLAATRRLLAFMEGLPARAEGAQEGPESSGARAPEPDTARDEPLAATVAEDASEPAAGTPSKPRPLTPDELRAWLASQSSPAPAPPPSRPSHPRAPSPTAVLGALLQRAGEPPELKSDLALHDELDELDALTEEGQARRWLDLSADAQVLWLSYLVARARALKDRLQFEPALKKRMRDVIVRFPEFAATARPGHVNGMRPGHEPLHGSWARDARAYLHELRALVGGPPTNGAAAPSAKPKSKDRPARQEAQPIEWALRDRVATMRIVLYGGAPREEARANLERVLGIGAIDWPESNKPRKVEALAVSLAAGKYDVLLVTRFVHHKDSNKLIAAAQAGHTPFAIVESGYGLEAVKKALEDALDREAKLGVPR